MTQNAISLAPCRHLQEARVVDVKDPVRISGACTSEARTQCLIKEQQTKPVVSSSLENAAYSHEATSLYLATHMLLSMDSTDVGQNHHHQQHVAVSFPFAPPAPPQQQQAHMNFVSPSSSATSTLSTFSCHSHGTTKSDHSVKRGRDQHESDSCVSDSDSFYQPPPQQSSSPAKRTRQNAYIAPTQVDPKSLLSQMGSLAAAPSSSTNNNSNLRVQFRRQLSGSNLESFFLGNSHDSMDVDTNDTRPRRMSF